MLPLSLTHVRALLSAQSACTSVPHGTKKRDIQRISILPLQSSHQRYNAFWCTLADGSCERIPAWELRAHPRKVVECLALYWHYRSAKLYEYRGLWPEQSESRQKARSWKRLECTPNLEALFLRKGTEVASLSVEARKNWCHTILMTTRGLPHMAPRPPGLWVLNMLPSFAVTMIKSDLASKHIVDNIHSTHSPLHLRTRFLTTWSSSIFDTCMSAPFRPTCLHVSSALRQKVRHLMKQHLAIAHFVGRGETDDTGKRRLVRMIPAKSAGGYPG